MANITTAIRITASTEEEYRILAAFVAVHLNSNITLNPSEKQVVCYIPWDGSTDNVPDDIAELGEYDDCDKHFTVEKLVGVVDPVAK